MRRLTLCCAAMIAAILSTPTADAWAGTGKPIGMVTGPQTGTYVQIGRDIAGLMKPSGIAIDVKPSLGSIDNLRRMSTRTENAGLGIVQSDVLGFLKRSQSAESQSIASKLRMVAPFFTEEVHIIARNDIVSVADLNGKRVVVGTEGSGSMITAMNIFGVLHVQPAALYKVGLPEGLVAVLTGQADAAVMVGGKPLKLLKNLEALQASTDSATAQAASSVHLLPLDDARLNEEYEAAVIAAGDYQFVKQDIPTVAVRAVLVSYDFTLKDTPFYHARCAELARVGTALRDKIGALQRTGHPKWKDVDLTRDVGIWRRDACVWPAMNAQATPAAVAKPEHRDHPKPSRAVAVKTLIQPPAVPSQTQRLQQDLLRAMQAQ